MAADDRQDGSASFTRFLREHDVPCPRCGYNLRGLERPTCPECGAGAGWGAYRRWGDRSSPAMIRGIEVCLYSCAILSLYLLAFVLPRAIGRNEPGSMAAAALIPACSALAIWAWVRFRGRLETLPSHRQARWASLAGVGLALAVLIATGAGAI